MTSSLAQLPVSACTRSASHDQADAEARMTSETSGPWAPAPSEPAHHLNGRMKSADLPPRQPALGAAYFVDDGPEPEDRQETAGPDRRGWGRQGKAPLEAVEQASFLRGVVEGRGRRGGSCARSRPRFS